MQRVILALSIALVVAVMSSPAEAQCYGGYGGGYVVAPAPVVVPVHYHAYRPVYPVHVYRPVRYYSAYRPYYSGYRGGYGYGFSPGFGYGYGRGYSRGGMYFGVRF